MRLVFANSRKVTTIGIVRTGAHNVKFNQSDEEETEAEKVVSSYFEVLRR